MRIIVVFPSGEYCGDLFEADGGGGGQQEAVLRRAGGQPHLLLPRQAGQDRDPLDATFRLEELISTVVLIIKLKLARPTYCKNKTTIFFFVVFKALVILPSAKDMLCLGELISTVKKWWPCRSKRCLQTLIVKKTCPSPNKLCDITRDLGKIIFINC